MVFTLASMIAGKGAGVRPREFNEDEVLRIAFERFWRSGLRGTTLADVARDTGVQRGSLYNAFGSKEALFLAAYGQHVEAYLGSMAGALGTGSLRERLTAFFDAAIRSFCAGAPPRGCPTTRGLMEISSIAGETPPQEVRAAFTAMLERLVTLLEGTLRDAAGRGEFRGDPRLMAEHLVAVARGLVVLERAFGDEARLRRIAHHAVELALFPPRGT